MILIFPHFNGSLLVWTIFQCCGFRIQFLCSFENLSYPNMRPVLILKLTALVHQCRKYLRTSDTLDQTLNTSRRSMSVCWFLLFSSCSALSTLLQGREPGGGNSLYLSGTIHISKFPLLQPYISGKAIINIKLLKIILNIQLLFIVEADRS